MIEFISYDGKYPNLCSGTLVIKVEGKEYSLKHTIYSTGRVMFDKEYGDYTVEKGPWAIYDGGDYLPKEIEKYEMEIIDIVNKNIPFGCCGGCS